MDVIFQVTFNSRKQQNKERKNTSMKSVIIALVMIFIVNAAKANYVIFKEDKSTPGIFPPAIARQYLSNSKVGVLFKRWDKATQTWQLYPLDQYGKIPGYHVRWFYPNSVQHNGHRSGEMVSPADLERDMIMGLAEESEIMAVQDYVMQHYTITIYTTNPFGYTSVTRYDSIYNAGELIIIYQPGIWSAPVVSDHINAMPQPFASGKLNITISNGDPVRQPAQP